MHLRCGETYNIYIIEIVHRVCQWKNFENRSIIGEDMDKSKVALLWTTLLAYRCAQCLIFAFKFFPNGDY